jgi:hypothetical protein
MAWAHWCWSRTRTCALIDGLPTPPVSRTYLTHGGRARAHASRGRYTFRFYKVAAGGWVNVTVDDNLPVDCAGQLVFSGAAAAAARVRRQPVAAAQAPGGTQQQQQQQPPALAAARPAALWPALFEKAYGQPTA